MALTFWFTGLSGAGKSTLSAALADSLRKRGVPCKVLDGDELRKGLCSDLGFGRADRAENIRRVAQVCQLLNSAGVVAIAALISPYLEDREMARRIVGANAFREVWLSTPLAECERRDAKGLYQRARAGEIAAFTGISDPYEAPLAAELTLNTHLLTVQQCVLALDCLLDSKGLLPCVSLV